MNFYFMLLILTFIEQIKGACHATSSSYNPIIVDPYVSILDKHNPNRYSVDDLISLLFTVAAKFNVIAINFDGASRTFEENVSSGKSLLPLAVAKYNGIVSNQTNCLGLWIFISLSKITLLGHIYKNFQMQSLSIKPEVIFPQELVETLYLSQKLKNSSDKGFLEDSLGWIAPECGSSINKLLVKTFQPKLLLVEYHIPETEKTDSEAVIANIQSTLTQCYESVDPTRSMNVNIGFFVSISDTLKTGRVFMTRMVTIINALRIWSEKTGTTIVFSKAFDTPLENTIGKKTDGWWRLKENSEYQSTTQFIFQDKQDIAKTFDLEENKPLLPDPGSSDNIKNKGQSGVILSFLMGVKALNSSLSKAQLDSLLKKASEKFSKAVILFDRNLELVDVDVMYLNEFFLKVREMFSETSFMFLSHIIESNYFPLISNLKTKETKSAFYFECEKNFGYTNLSKVRVNLLNNDQQQLCNFGCTFDISVCGLPVRRDITDIENANQTFTSQNIINIAFQYEEDLETIKLGASRMFEQRIVVFEQCKKYLFEYEKGYEVIFVLLNYATDMQFYSDPWALQTFVKYWEMLQNWSKSSNTTVILGDVLDGTRVLEEGLPPVAQIGWWRHLQSGENVEWIDKRTDALSVAKDINSNQVTLSPSNHQLTIILIATIFLFFAITISTIYFVRLRYRKMPIDKEEINDFLNGVSSPNSEPTENQVDITISPFVLPYDKLKYEFEPNNFSVDFDKILGSGEFGLVLRGKIESGQHVGKHVAVKVTNEKKFSQTSLTSLLGEIKILAYIGKHDHIIELIGANTTDIRNGKVFVFLELCVLGSLEKYLRKLQPELLDSYAEKNNVAENINGPNYENIELGDMPVLDPSLCSEFYCWSVEICSAMAYLSTKHVVHADLAARNVLLNANKQTKICDFGLSRRMYNYTNYVKTKQEPLPWKWMSPESLKICEFNEKTDIWAYGVLLWEIYSLGDTPYSGLSWDVNFVRVLEGGLRLGKPKYDNQNMYSRIMNECWKLNPKMRPTFAEILMRLSTLDVEH